MLTFGCWDFPNNGIVNLTVEYCRRAPNSGNLIVVVEVAELFDTADSLQRRFDLSTNINGSMQLIGL